MKKILAGLVISSSFLFSAPALAKDGLYAAADLVLSNASYKFVNPNQTAPQNRVDGSSVGVGATLGYKKSFKQFFVAPEVFYDYLNSSSPSYFHTTQGVEGDTLEIRSRYGIKANLGYDFTQNFSSYLTYGIAALDRISRYPSFNYTQGKWETAAIYGIGAQYHLSENWSMRAEFNSQRFNAIYYAVPGSTSKIRLNVLKIGILYNF